MLLRCLTLSLDIIGVPTYTQRRQEKQQGKIHPSVKLLRHICLDMVRNHLLGMLPKAVSKFTAPSPHQNEFPQLNDTEFSGPQLPTRCSCGLRRHDAGICPDAQESGDHRRPAAGHGQLCGSRAQRFHLRSAQVRKGTSALESAFKLVSISTSPTKTLLRDSASCPHSRIGMGKMR